MRKLPVFVFALVLAAAVVGCDSDEDLTDAEIFVGSWTVVEVNDNEGDKTDVFEAGVQEFSADLDGDGTFTLVVDYVDPQRPATELGGTYRLEGSNLILDTGPQEISFGYDIESENRIDLSVDEAVVQAVFGADEDTYDGTVVFTVERN